MKFFPALKFVKFRAVPYVSLFLFVLYELLLGQHSQVWIIGQSHYVFITSVIVILIAIWVAWEPENQPPRTLPRLIIGISMSFLLLCVTLVAWAHVLQTFVFVSYMMFRIDPKNMTVMMHNPYPGLLGVGIFLWTIVALWSLTDRLTKKIERENEG